MVHCGEPQKYTRTLQTSKVHRGKSVDALGWYGTITCEEMRWGMGLTTNGQEKTYDSKAFSSGNDGSLMRLHKLP